MLVITFWKVPLANFRRLLAIFWKHCLWQALKQYLGHYCLEIGVCGGIFFETALMTTFESSGHLDVWLARLDLRERLLANLLERI